ncbi:MAG: hypothetical protein DRP29_07165 [Thermodesulfobacteriota bacterium]|nr:MAG: hypothetical protein DRP29_07165 [Thermodesulfobacteriota bacterium]
MIWTGRVTLSSDASGDATASLTGVPTGEVLGIYVVNSADAQPSDNWDLTVRNTNVSGGSTAVPNKILVDESVSQAVTDVIRYHPTIEGNLSSDGSAQTLNDNIRILNMKTTVDFIGANMGASKKAYVTLFIKY